MKKEILTAATILLIGTVSCRNNSSGTVADSDLRETERTGESAVSPAAADSTGVTGIVFDAAMNSLVLVTPQNDTLRFGYPELDRSRIEHFSLNDTVTVWLQQDTVVRIVKK